MTLRDLVPVKFPAACALVAVASVALLFGAACAKKEQEAAPAASSSAAPAADEGTGDQAAPAEAAPAASPDAKEQELLAKAKSATTPEDRRAAYAELVRLHPENKQYKHQLKKARREAKQSKKGQAGQPD